MNFWLPVGVVSLLLGIAGILLPVLPTTPFVLASAWCFARSSPRLSAWLQQHPVFGGFITRWEETRSISKLTRYWALFCIALFGGSSLYFFVPAGWPFWLASLLLLAGAIIVLRLKTS